MANILARFQLLELHVISAQDLAPAGRSMRTYAVAWIDPDRKLSTRVDSHGGTNPTWNDKFVFRMDQDFLYDDSSVITIDIYALHWFRDIHVGTAEVLSSDLFPPSSQPQQPNAYKSTGMRFLGLQVQRPSGRPKGILNVGAAIIDSSIRSMPLYSQNSPIIGYSQDDHDQPKQHEPKPELRRTKSDSSSMLGSETLVPEPHEGKTKQGKANSQVPTSEISSKSKKKAISILSGSFVKGTPKDGKLGRKKTKARGHDSQNNFNDYQVKPTPKREFQNSPFAVRSYNNNYMGSVRATPMHAFPVTDTIMEYGTPYRSNLGHRPFMTDSELGPSASEVAAAVARLPMEEEGHSTVGGWSLDDDEEGMQPKVERWQTESNATGSGRKGKHPRRQTDGSNGLFSCFSVICGVECSIVCGGGSKKHRRRRVQSVDNESFV